MMRIKYRVAPKFQGRYDKAHRVIQLMFEEDEVMSGISDVARTELAETLATEMTVMTDQIVDSIDTLETDEDYNYFDFGTVHRYLADFHARRKQESSPDQVMFNKLIHEFYHRAGVRQAEKRRARFH